MAPTTELHTIKITLFNLEKWQVEAIEQNLEAKDYNHRIEYLREVERELED